MVILFNKPYGVLSQFTPEAGHRALDEFGFPPGVYAAGRLDHDSEGALLLTDDGRLIKRLLDPKNAHPRTYLAQVDGEITERPCKSWRRGSSSKVTVPNPVRRKECKHRKTYGSVFLLSVIAPISLPAGFALPSPKVKTVRCDT